MSEHAIYSPSASRRWTNCYASLHACAQFPDTEDNLPAIEGTAAHWLFERTILDGTFAEDSIGNVITVTTRSGLQVPIDVDFYFAKGVSLMVDVCRRFMQVPGFTSLEARVALPHIDPDLWGRGDFFHDTSAHDGILTYVDFKNGRLDVQAEANSQCFTYGSGALHTPEVVARPELVRFVRLVIVQPNSLVPGPRVKEQIIPVAQMLEWENLLRFAIDQTKKPDARFISGDWCTYCPALGMCPATRNKIEKTAPLLTLDPAKMTLEQLVKVQQIQKMTKKIMEKVETELGSRLMKGMKVEGAGLFTGVTHRAWVNDDRARDEIFRAFGVEGLRPPTPAQAEQLGEGAKELVDRLSQTPPGPAKVGLDGDKRKPYTRRSAAEIFG